MRKTYKLTDLDCAHCAAKMENAIKKIDGVTDATADEAESKKAILASAAEVFFLMDHTKLDSCAFYQVCPLPQAGRLIVDFQPGIREKHAEFFFFF